MKPPSEQDRPWKEDKDGKVTRPYKGFYPPRYTQIPDDLLDHVMAWLTGGELKVLLFLCRRTFGFKKDSARLTLKRIASGVEKYNAGVQLDPRQVRRILRNLEEKGLVVSEPTVTARGDPGPSVYRLNIRGKI